VTKPNKLFLLLLPFRVWKESNLKKFALSFSIDLVKVETTPSVQESIGIFQLIDQLESAVDKLLERQVYFACTGWGDQN
jgi:S-methylmethionine-dependent homocysteine/selenocysteine methylase